MTKDEWQQAYDDAGSILELSRRLVKDYFWVRNQLLRQGIAIRSSGYKSPKHKRSYAENHHNWKGGTYITKGYVLEYAPDHPAAATYKGYVPQHRLVMEQALGRYLSSDELVHHRNEIKTDNRLENLELTARSSHIKHHKTAAPRDGRGRFISANGQHERPERVSISA